MPTSAVTPQLLHRPRQRIKLHLPSHHCQTRELKQSRHNTLLPQITTIQNRPPAATKQMSTLPTRLPRANHQLQKANRPTFQYHQPIIPHTRRQSHNKQRPKQLPTVLLQHRQAPTQEQRQSTHYNSQSIKRQPKLTQRTRATTQQRLMRHPIKSLTSHLTQAYPYYSCRLTSRQPHPKPNRHSHPGRRHHNHLPNKDPNEHNHHYPQLQPTKGASPSHNSQPPHIITKKPFPMQPASRYQQ